MNKRENNYPTKVLYSFLNAAFAVYASHHQTGLFQLNMDHFATTAVYCYLLLISKTTNHQGCTRGVVRGKNGAQYLDGLNFPPSLVLLCDGDVTGFNPKISSASSRHLDKSIITAFPTGNFVIPYYVTVKVVKYFE